MSEPTNRRDEDRLQEAAVRNEETLRVVRERLAPLERARGFGQFVLNIEAGVIRSLRFEEFVKIG